VIVSAAVVLPWASNAAPVKLKRRCAEEARRSTEIALDRLLLRPRRVGAQRQSGVLERGQLGGDLLERVLLTRDGSLAVADLGQLLAFERHQLVDDRGGVDARGESGEAEAGHSL
jgi:hypothetical protein